MKQVNLFYALFMSSGVKELVKKYSQEGSLNEDAIDKFKASIVRSILITLLFTLPMLWARDYLVFVFFLLWFTLGFLCMFRGDYSRRCLSYTFGIKRPATIIGLENNLGLYQLGKQAIVTRTCFEPKLNFSTVFSGELRLGKEYVMPPKNSIDIYLYMYKSGKYLAMPDLPLHKKYFSLSKSIL